MFSIKKTSEKLDDFLDDYKLSYWLFILIILIVAFIVLWFFKVFLPPSFYSTTLYKVIDTIFLIAPIWLPIILAYIFWKFWLVYIRSNFLKDQEYSLLEIRLPRELERTPAAMESIFTGLHISSGETTFIDKYWKGKVRPWFSLEIVSVEGNIRFFLWTRSPFRNLVESQIYAQYPQVEIHEVSDYTENINRSLEGISLWGSDFILDEPDYEPIKTYIDYGLDREEEEERKTDPLASVLEFMASIGKGEQVWIQILFQKYQERWERDGLWFKEVSWEDDAEEAVDELMKRDPGTKGPTESMRTSEGFVVHPALTDTEKKKIDAIQRGIRKSAFHCGIRGIYLAEPDKFNGINIPGLIGAFNHFKSEDLNNFRPFGWLSDFNFPWQDYRGIRQKRTQRKLFDAYKRRSYFRPPYSYKERPFVLNTEELATIFHFPGWIVQPPTLERIPSKRAEPPSELPM